MNQAGGVTKKHCVAGRPRHHAVDVDGHVVVVVVVVFIEVVDGHVVVVVVVFIEVVDGHVIVFDGDIRVVIMVDKDTFRSRCPPLSCC